MEETIEYETFKKVVMKTAVIEKAEKIGGVDKLLKLEIDVGGEKRTLVAGIAQHYKPDDLTGKVIIIVYNLKPKKIKGIESQGMLLAVEDEKGIALLTTDRKVKSGLRVW